MLKRVLAVLAVGLLVAVAARDIDGTGASATGSARYTPVHVSGACTPGRQWSLDIEPGASSLRATLVLSDLPVGSTWGGSITSTATAALSAGRTVDYAGLQAGSSQRISRALDVQPGSGSTTVAFDFTNGTSVCRGSLTVTPSVASGSFRADSVCAGGTQASTLVARPVAAGGIRWQAAVRRAGTTSRWATAATYDALTSPYATHQNVDLMPRATGDDHAVWTTFPGAAAARQSFDVTFTNAARTSNTCSLNGRLG